MLILRLKGPVVVKAKITKIVQYLDDILNFKDKECTNFQEEKIAQKGTKSGF